ncbi:MAG: hypothetical protein C4318_04410 [Acidimicrobiia bacterium]
MPWLRELWVCWGVEGTAKKLASSRLAKLAEQIRGIHELMGIGDLSMPKGDIVEYVVDISTTKELLGCYPRVSLADGLALTFEASGLSVKP